MGEGEDGVPDAVTHVDVEHPEVHCTWWAWPMYVECQNVLSGNEFWLHNKMSSARVVRSYFQWRPDNFELPIFNSADLIRFKGKCFRTLRSWREYQISSWIGWLRQTSRHMMLHTSQSDPFVVFDLYWEGTMEKLIIWTGGQRRLSYRYTLGNLEKTNQGQLGLLDRG